MHRFVGVSQHSYVKLNTVLKTQKVTSVVFVEVRYFKFKRRVLDNFTRQTNRRYLQTIIFNHIILYVLNVIQIVVYITSVFRYR